MSIASAAGSGLVTTMEDLPGHAGEDLGRTDWSVMTQERVSGFADLTEDHNFLHVDVERARQTRFGGTVAHGYLSLSLLAPIAQQLLRISDARLGLNYGLDRVRFPAPLPTGARFRGQATLCEVDAIEDCLQTKMRLAVEVENQQRPALVADAIFRFYP